MKIRNKYNVVIIEWEQSRFSRKWLKIKAYSLLKLATGTKLGKDFKKNNLSNCSKWLAIEYKKGCIIFSVGERKISLPTLKFCEKIYCLSNI